MSQVAHVEAVPLRRPVARFRFREGIALDDRSPGDDDIRNVAPGWVNVMHAHLGVSMHAVFDWQVYADFVRRAEQLSPGFTQTRYRRYFRIEFPGPIQDVGSLRALLTDSLPLEYLSIQTHLPPPPLAPLAGTHFDEQQYLHRSAAHVVGQVEHAAFEGINLEAVRCEPGGRGEGQVLCDVEQGWSLEHPWLPADGRIAHVPGSLSAMYESHGLKILSVCVAQGDGADATGGGVGIAPDVDKVWLSSEHRELGENGTAAAIEAALTKLGPGHVLLLETQVFASDVGATSPDGNVMAFSQLPCEIRDELFDAIQLATALHVVVVEAAGNGNETSGAAGRVDLDKLEVKVQGVVTRPLNVDTRDSGAILVGESDWTTDDSGDWGHVARKKACVGARVGSFAWGNNVYVASNGPAGHDAGFGGTSSAAAIVAGAALVLQGLRTKQPAPYLSPLQLRALLSDPSLNTPTAAATPHIGVMPDLEKLGVQLGSLPDLYVRDNLADTGDLTSGNLSMSPDIIVRSAPQEPDPTDYQEGSGTEDRLDLSQDVVQGQQAWILVRARNRGAVDAVGARAKVYFAPSATLVMPSSWTAVGETDLPTVPGDGTLVVSAPITWPAPPDPGHYCFVAIVSHPQDDVLDPTTRGDLSLAQFVTLVSTENGIAWRNFQIVGDPELQEDELIFSLRVFVSGADDRDRDMELVVESSLPRSSRVQVTLPVGPREPGERAAPALTTADRAADRLQLQALPGRATLGLFHLARQVRAKVVLRVSVPRADVAGPLEVALVQRDLGRDVGRVTWQLLPPPDPT